MPDQGHQGQRLEERPRDRDQLSIHQETLDLVAKNGPAEGFTLTKLPDTFGFDQTDFQPILNKLMEA